MCLTIVHLHLCEGTGDFAESRKRNAEAGDVCSFLPKNWRIFVPNKIQQQEEYRPFAGTIILRLKEHLSPMSNDERLTNACRKMTIVVTRRQLARWINDQELLLQSV